MQTHYDNLKVARNAPSEIIKAAYKTLAQKYHPDLNPGSAEAARVMVMVNQAYAVLSDPARRKQHDDWITEQERPAPQAQAVPQPAYVAPPQRDVPDPRKARGIGWLRFCRWVTGALFGFQVMSWLGAIYQSGGISQFLASTSLFALLLSGGWTWLLWYSFHELRRRINEKHTLGYGYPHPAMRHRWAL